MKKFLYKGAIYLTITLILAIGISQIGLWALSRGNFYKPSFLVNGLKTVDNFELVLFGSSRGLAALDTYLIQEEFSEPAANLCVDDTALPSHFLMMKHFFHQGKKVKYVILSLDIADFDRSENKIGDNDFQFLPFVKNSYVKEHYNLYEKGIIKPLSNSSWFPLLGYSFYNMQLLYPSLQSLANPEFRYRFDGWGNYQYPDHLGMKESDQLVQHKTSLSNPLLFEIKEFVESQGSQLVIYIAPYLRDEILVETDQTFELINHSRKIQNPMFFSDDIHLVNSGKIIATKAFIRHFRKLKDKK
jgi:hypothetical protein